ncbi:MAG: ABC transporter permease subunit [Chloroflexi bacterium]|nr:MAG: ABC transporter permease subunit [Chloroflexota bacterium]
MAVRVRGSLARAKEVPRRRPTIIGLRRVLGRDWATAWLFLAPCLVVLVGLIAYPFVSAILLSFQAKLVGSPGVWVGFQNYQELFTGRDLSSQFWQSVRVTAFFTLAADICKLVLGMAMALLLNEQFRGRTFLRALFFLPWAVPSLIVGLTWKWMYDGSAVGLLNMLVLRLGLTHDLIQWLASYDLALWAVVVAVVWASTPFWAMMFLAGLQAIPGELYEAAEIDGADVFGRFRHITLPGLANVMIITALLSTIWTATSINFVYVLTNGGPAGATMTFPMLAYQVGVAGAQRLGMGAAISLVFALFFLPWAVPSLIVGLTWKWMYDGSAVGLLNMLVLRLGLTHDLIQWLASYDLALWAVVVAVVWASTPFWAMMFLAGLQAIPGELYEAAEIDGADVFGRFRHITLPGLANVMIITALLSTIWTATSINFVYVLTNGGPAGATMTFPMLAYQVGVAGAQRLGMGAAISLVFFPFFLVLIYILTRRMLAGER